MSISAQMQRRRPAPSSLRLESCPPSLRHAPDSPWLRLLFWLVAPAPQDAALPPTRLQAVRADFRSCLADLATTPQADALKQSVEAACTLRELWHLRAEAYRQVSLQHRQATADARLAALNRHFPTRGSRPGLVLQ